LVSGIQEIIASLFQWRSKHLKESILQMMLDHLSSEDLEDPAAASQNSLNLAKGLRDEIYKNSLVQSMNHISIRLPWWGGNKRTAGDYKSAYKKSNPSYLESETFSTALIEALKEEKIGLKSELEKLIEKPEEMVPSQLLFSLKNEIEKSEKIPESFKKTLYSLADRAIMKAKGKENELLAFQKKIETWFDRSMERSSGVYKRNSQLLCFILGFFIAVVLNIDSLSIYQRLLVDTTLRTTLADGGQIIVQDYQKILSESGESKTGEEPKTGAATKSFQDSVNKYVDNTLPIGLIIDVDNQANLRAECSNGSPDCKIGDRKFNLIRIVLALLGWLITTLAIYMGAPFWFELLGKLVNVRSTGSKPKE
jgi:hypothetical protein